LKITDACWQHPAIGRKPENEDCFTTLAMVERTASDLAFFVHKLANEFIALHKKVAAVPNNARK
jgi:hypothetical protein